MAEVYLARSIAEDPGNRRAVAIKRVLPFLSKDADFIKLFEREIGLTFQMTHPNLVKVYESGYIDGQYFIAMEHVLGKTLQGFIANTDSMKDLRETPFALYVVREICKALTYAHTYRDPVTNSAFGITHPMFRQNKFSESP